MWQIKVFKIAMAKATMKDHFFEFFAVCRVFIFALVLVCAYFQGSDFIWNAFKVGDELITPNMRDNLTSSLKNMNKTVWKPKGCSIHNYSSKEFSSCWGETKQPNLTLFFLGDSHERDIYSMFVTKIRNLEFVVKKDIDILSYYQEGLNLTLRYQFMPIMNDSFRDKFLSWEVSGAPNLIVIGCNLHPILTTLASKVSRYQHRQNLTRLLPYLDNLARKTNVLWYIQPPVIDEKVLQYRSVIKNRQIDLYNKINLEIVSRTRVKIWTSAREIATDQLNFYRDDIHVGKSACEYFTQILSNFWCGERFNFPDGTCWRKETGNFNSNFQYFFISLISSVCFIILLRKNQRVKSIWKCFRKSAMVANEIPNCKKEISKVGSVLKILIYLGYVYICERVPVFVKQQIIVSELFIFVAVLLGMALLIFFNKNLEAENQRKQQILNETKGLVVIIMLLCSVNSNWETLAVERLTESTFLLLMGAELMLYSWSDESMNFSHFMQTIFRQNLLVVLLCLVMGHPYIEYGVLPVALLCYTFSYTVLVSPPRPPKVVMKGCEHSSISKLTKVMAYLIKISLIVGTFMYIHNSMSVERQLLSHPIARSLFSTKEDTLSLFAFRWKLDKFSIPTGIVIGFIVEINAVLSIKKPSLSVGRLSLVSWSIKLISAIFFSVKFVSTYQSLYLLKGESSNHKFLVVYLAASYVSFRSCLVQIWPKYSEMLAALGSVWLEVYLLHFHIWMAFDGNAFLVLIPFSSTINFCATTLILLFAAYDIQYSIINLIR